jgi:hypothetical protein
MKPVTKEQFEQFIQSYPRPLNRNVALMCEPPVVTYNDFSLGMWPASVVARHTFESPRSMVPSEWAIKETACIS